MVEKTIFWGVELWSVNSYILYKEVQRRENEFMMTQLTFICKLVDELIGDFRQRLRKVINIGQGREIKWQIKYLAKK